VFSSNINVAEVKCVQNLLFCTTWKRAFEEFEKPKENKGGEGRCRRLAITSVGDLAKNAILILRQRIKFTLKDKGFLSKNCHWNAIAQSTCLTVNHCIRRTYNRDDYQVCLYIPANRECMLIHWKMHSPAAPAAPTCQQTTVCSLGPNFWRKFVFVSIYPQAILTTHCQQVSTNNNCDTWVKTKRRQS